MFCAQCGTRNEEGNAFCRNCGQPLVAVASAAASQQHNGYRAAPTYGAQPAYAPAPAPEGVLGAAWRDITGTPGWFKRVLMLCLLGCIPILNLAVMGFAVRWGRELSFGNRSQLPKSIFRKHEVTTGFTAFVVEMAYLFAWIFLCFAIGMVSGAVFGLIPVVGPALVALVVLAIFVAGIVIAMPLMYAGVMRYSVVGYLEAAFNFKMVWSAFRRKMGSLIGAVVVPPLVIGIVQSIVVGLLIAIALAMAGLVANDAYSGGYITRLLNRPEMLFGVMMTTGGFSSLFFCLGLVVSEMLVTFSALLVCRAVGHWVSRYAPEWAAEAEHGMPESAPDMAGDSGLDGAAANAAPGGNGEVRNTAWSANAGVHAPEPAAAATSHVNPAPASSVPEVNEPTTSIPPAPPAAVVADGKTTQIGAAPGPRVTLMRVSTGTTYQLPSLPATVGKGSAADVTIEGTELVSRLHVSIDCPGGDFTVEDLHATNGTMLNGRPLDPGMKAPLADGDILKLADEEFTVRIR